MPSSAIDTSQVQWDAPATPAIDPSQIAWDAPSGAAVPKETASRVVGLGDRALIHGIGQLADTPGALMQLADKAGGTVHDYIRGIFGLKPDAAPPEPASPGPSATQVMDAGANMFGLPNPATPVERVASSAVSALPSSLLNPEAPIASGLSSLAGGAASQTTAELGGGPLAQTVAGLAAGSVPAIGSATAATTRGIVRGGAQGAADMQATIDNAAANNIPLTVGQASGSNLVQRLEATSGSVWGGGAIKNAAKNQAEGLSNSVDGIVDRLAPGADVSPTSAGTAINAGVATTKQNMRAAEKAAYDKVDQVVPPDSPVDVSATLAKLGNLATPTPGAANTTGSLVSPKIAALSANLKADVAANGGSPVLPYSATTALRTALGNSIDWGFAPADPVTNGALKLVHGALKGDIDNAASSISPQAGQAVTDARSLYAQNQARRDALNAIVDKSGGPEAVYQAATNGTKNGATKIGSVMTAIDPGQQNLVRATVLDRLGRAIPSQQNAAGSVFNPETFLTNWNKLDPTAKDALFGTSGAPNTLRAGLDSLTNTLTTLRDSNALKNPSGTADKIGHAATAATALGAVLEHALSGNPKGAAIAAGTALGGAGLNMALSRALVNPKVVAWMAQTTKLPTSAVPNAIHQLALMNDPDAKALAAQLQ